MTTESPTPAPPARPITLLWVVAVAAGAAAGAGLTAALHLYGGHAGRVALCAAAGFVAVFWLVGSLLDLVGALNDDKTLPVVVVAAVLAGAVAGVLGHGTNKPLGEQVLFLGGTAMVMLGGYGGAKLFAVLQRGRSHARQPDPE